MFAFILRRSLPLSSTRLFSTLSPPLGLQISPSAAQRIASLRSRALAEGHPDAAHLCLRVRVDGGGCSGFRYEFLVEHAAGGGAGADDAVFEAGPARVLVDAASLDFLKGATLDWEESMMRSAFTISQNPNADSSCGCKASFSLKPPAAAVAAQ